jgi:phage N-6-adenine-methyltransferase
MNRQTRDRFVLPTQEDLTTGNACLETPPQVFAKLQDDFGPFDIDLTANESNHLCLQWFGPGSPLAEDALTAPWHLAGKTGYSNPPYGRFVAKILKKAKAEAAKGFASTFLLPVRMKKAIHEYVLYGAAELWFCDKRIAFWQDGAPKLDSASQKPTGALFDSMIVRYKPGMRFSPPRAGSWKVPKHHSPMGWG